LNEGAAVAFAFDSMVACDCGQHLRWNHVVTAAETAPADESAAG